MIKGKHLVGLAILAAGFVGVTVWAAKFYYQSSSASANADVMELFRNPGGTPLLNAVGKPPADPAPSGSMKPLTINSVEDPKLGTRLVSVDGRALYYFANDSSGVSACTGNCATNWPPFMAKADASLMGGADVKQEISTIIREEGTLQVTYGGKPLYFWHNDKEAGDASGQGVGGVWFVAQP